MDLQFHNFLRVAAQWMLGTDEWFRLWAPSLQWALIIMLSSIFFSWKTGIKGSRNEFTEHLPDISLVRIDRLATTGLAAHGAALFALMQFAAAHTNIISGMAPALRCFGLGIFCGVLAQIAFSITEQYTRECEQFLRRKELTIGRARSLERSYVFGFNLIVYSGLCFIIGVSIVVQILSENNNNVVHVLAPDSQHGKYQYYYPKI